METFIPMFVTKENALLNKLFINLIINVLYIFEKIHIAIIQIKASTAYSIYRPATTTFS